MARISKHVLAVALGLALGTTACIAGAEVVVIVSAKSPVHSLTADQAADIFLGKASSFPGGGAAVPLDQAEGSAVRDEFYNKAAGKNAAQLKAYWSKQIFTGKGHPPKEAGDNAGVKSAVAANPNAVGYVDKSAVDASVKAVLSVK